MDSAEAQRQQRVLDGVERALDWPVAEHERRLLAAFGDDPELHAEIGSLLAAALHADRSLPTALPLAMALGADLPPPAMLGPYRIGAMLGRGGMGRVYRGERVDGVFRQSVAVKLLRHSLLTTSLAAQFARERQILASLQHPNIARLLDGGIDGEGHSYIVMELLKGEPITQFAADQRLDLHASLRLFLKICDAVAYAHAHLVVHADIKPSNVIVDEDGNPKLVDFGVARLLAAAGGDDPFGEPLGITLDYSSAARRAGEPATTADDVFSLGVVLEELLARCGVLPADLRSVIEHARAASPEGRFAGVGALRGDLARWLDGLPVQAHGAALTYVAGKYLRRHRIAASVVAALALMLAAASVATGISYLNAEKARRKAEQHFANLHALSRFALIDVYDKLEQVPRALALRRDVAERAQRYLDGLAADPGAAPTLRLEVIEGLRRLAQVQAAPGSASLGQTGTARSNLDRAEAMIAQLPDTPDIHIERLLLAARLHLQRAEFAHALDLDFVGAGRELQQCRVLVDLVLGEVPTDLRARRLELDWAVENAALLQWRGDYSGSQAVARAALKRHQALPASARQQRTDVLQRTRLLDILAESMFYGGDPAAAEAPYREQRDVLQNLVKANPQDVYLSRRLARAGWALGSTLLEIGRAEEGVSILSESRMRLAQLRLLDPEDSDLARMLDITEGAYASGLVALDRYPEALPLLEHSAQERGRLADADANNASLRRDHGIGLTALGDALAQSGQKAAACARYVDAFTAFDKVRALGRLSELDADFSLQRLRRSKDAICRSPSRLQHANQ